MLTSDISNASILGIPNTFKFRTRKYLYISLQHCYVIHSKVCVKKFKEHKDNILSRLE